MAESNNKHCTLCGHPRQDAPEAPCQLCGANENPFLGYSYPYEIEYLQSVIKTGVIIGVLSLAGVLVFVAWIISLSPN